MAHAGLITWLRTAILVMRFRNSKRIGHALSILPDTLNFKWSAIIDADEYIMMDFDKFGSFSEYLNWQEEVPSDAIALNWIFFRRQWSKNMVQRSHDPTIDFQSASRGSQYQDGIENK